MNTEDVVNDFWGLAEDIFCLEYNDKVLHYNKRLRINKSFFWKKLYIKRGSEDQIFDDFVDGNADIMFVTGYAGIGKSTFIANKYTRMSKFRGMIITMEELVDKFNGINDINIAIRACIKDKQKNMLLANLKNAIYFKENSEKKTIPRHLWEGHELNMKAKKKLALESLYYLNDNKEILDFINTNRIFALEEDLFYKKAEDSLDGNNEEIIMKILDYPSWKEYVKLYRLINKISCPYIITFDNLDRIDFHKINATLIDGMLDALHDLNIEEPNYQQEFYEKTKFILAIRDENIERVKKEAAGDTRSIQLALGTNHFTMRDAKSVSISPLDDRMIYEIIDRRISLLKNIVTRWGRFTSPDTLKMFIIMTEKFWIDRQTNSIKGTVGFLNIKKLCNESIRMILDLLFDTVKESVKNYQSQGGVASGVGSMPPSVFKGKLIKTLWDHSSTKELMIELSDSIIDEKKAPRCCVYRIILSYLFNQNRISNNNFICCDNLVSELHNVFGYTENEIKRALFHLYWSKYKLAELITIYQYNPINNYRDIDNAASIRLNEKGIIFLDRVIIHLDFYGQLIRLNPSIVNKTYKTIGESTLYELLPDAALKYIEMIYTFINEISNKHYEYWHSTIVQSLKSFDVYMNKYGYKNEFFIERVAQSHKNMIKNYLYQVLRGDESELYMNRQSNESFKINYPTNFIKDVPIRSAKIDQVIDEIITKQFSKRNEIYLLWELYKKYSDTKNKFEKLHII